MRIAILRALGLGDLLTAVPALRALRRAHPAAELVLGAPAGLEPLVGLIGAELAVAGIGPFLSTPPAGPLPPAMQAADLAVNLHGAGPQSVALLRSGAPGRLISYGVTSRWRAEEHEVRRWCRLLAEAGIPADPAELALCRGPEPSPAPGAVVLHPGAASGARRWPAERWAEVAAALAGDGRRVVLTGGSAEVPLADAIAAAAGLPTGAVLAGHTSLRALAALIAGAAVVVCGDTGVAHLASAYGTPSVLLFGPTSPELWGPPPRRRHRVLWAGQPGNPHAAEPGPGLLALSADAVLTAARGLLWLPCM